MDLTESDSSKKLDSSGDSITASPIDKKYVKEMLAKIREDAFNEFEEKVKMEFKQLGINPYDPSHMCKFIEIKKDIAKQAAVMRQSVEQIEHINKLLEPTCNEVVISESNNKLRLLESQLKENMELFRAVLMLSKTLPIDDVIIRYLNGTQKDDRINDIIDAIDSKLNIISKMTSAKGIYAIDKFTNVIRSLADNVSLITYERLISSLDSISSLDINAHVIQGGVLIKHSGVFSFLDKWYPNVANEFVRSYSNILGYYYLYHFVRYGMLLEQRKVSPDKVTRSLNSESSLNIRLSSYFEVAQDDSVIVLGINQDNKSYFPEELVRSVLIAFKDNAYMEYQFECGFFKHSKLLCDILSKTVSYMKDFIINIIVGTKVVDLVSLILALTSVKYCIGTAVCRAAHQIRDFYNEINVEIQSLYDKYVTLLKTPIMTSITKASNYGLVDDYALKKISLDFVKLLTFILSSGRNIFAGSDDAGLGDIVSRYYSFIHNLPHSPKAQPSREAARKLNALMLVSNMLSEYKLASFDDSKVRVEAEIKKVVADFVELELSESFDLNRKPDIESYKSRLSSLHKYFLSKVTDKSVCDSILDVLIDSLANKLRSLHGDGNDLSNVLFSWREIARSRDSSRK